MVNKYGVVTNKATVCIFRDPDGSFTADEALRSADEFYKKFHPADIRVPRELEGQARSLWRNRVVVTG